jgi:tetratricopeptide (TPR) repeat protein
MTEDALRQGVAYFESALERDPRFALAYAGLADSYSLFAFLDLMRPRDAFSRARELAVSALRIDANLPEAHIALAAIMHFYDWDKTGAEVEYRRALALNPNSAAARRSYAAHLCSLGRFSEALEHLRWAQDLDPLSLTIGNEIAWTLYIAGDYEAALRQAWKTLALEPRFPAAQHTLGLANLQLGLFEDAIIELRNACACSGNHPAAQASLAGALAVTGARDEAAKILHALVEWSRERYISPYSLGTIYAALEEHTTAFQYLERAIAERDVWMVWLALDPRYAALRSDPRWTKLISSLT